MQELGKSLIIFGVILTAAGIFLFFAHKIPFLGKMPGDIFVQRKNFTFYFPIVTSLILSFLISLFLGIWQKR